MPDPDPLKMQYTVLIPQRCRILSSFDCRLSLRQTETVFGVRGSYLVPEIAYLHNRMLYATGSVN